MRAGWVLALLAVVSMGVACSDDDSRPREQPDVERKKYAAPRKSICDELTTVLTAAGTGGWTVQTYLTGDTEDVALTCDLSRRTTTHRATRPMQGVGVVVTVRVADEDTAHSLYEVAVSKLEYGGTDSEDAELTETSGWWTSGRRLTAVRKYGYGIASVRQDDVVRDANAFVEVLVGGTLETHPDVRSRQREAAAIADVLLDAVPNALGRE